MRIVVIADTHLRNDVTSRLGANLLSAIASCDLLLHAGDVTTPETLQELSALATVNCVLGNNDGLLAGQVPEELILEIEGVTVAMIHDSGPSNGRAARLYRHFPEANVIVYGHSHVPESALGLGGQRLFNPGSPTQRRAQPECTYGALEIRDGTVISNEIHAT